MRLFRKNTTNLTKLQQILKLANGLNVREINYLIKKLKKSKKQIKIRE